MPWAAAVLVVVLMVGSGVLVAGVGRRAAAGRLRINPFAGIRTVATMRDAEAWRRAHEAARWAFDLAGAGFVLGGIAALPVFPPPVTVVAVLTASAWGVGWVIVGGVRGDRAAREPRAAPDRRTGRDRAARRNRRRPAGRTDGRGRGLPAGGGAARPLPHAHGPATADRAVPRVPAALPARCRAGRRGQGVSPRENAGPPRIADVRWPDTGREVVQR